MTRPLHASTLDAITAAVRRHYLRPVSLEPDPVTPDRWAIRIEGRAEVTRTEIILSLGRYTFQDAKQKPNQ
jgi:hypothetical protein